MEPSPNQGLLLDSLVVAREVDSGATQVFDGRFVRKCKNPVADKLMFELVKSDDPYGFRLLLMAKDLQDGVREAISIQALDQRTEMQFGLAIESQKAILSVKRRLTCELLIYYSQAYPCLYGSALSHGYGKKYNRLIKWKFVEANVVAYYWTSLVIFEDDCKLLLMDEGDIFGIITLDRERARSITIAKTIVVMRKMPLKPKGIHISGDITKVSTLPASTRILESTKKDKEGVVSAITPWNFPLAVITRKVGSALVCGCTVIVKPSELTPLTALAAVELALQTGIPPGVLNMVMWNASDISDALLASPHVRKIIYTDSTAVGKRLMKGVVGTVRSIPLKLGGNATCIIFDDADLDVAVKGVLAAKFRNSGQTCVCANKVIVQEGIYERFAVAFSKAVKNLQVGDGFIEGVVQGQLINEDVLQKVESFLQDALSKGAKVILRRKRHSLGMTFYEPTIVTDVKTGMLLAREEVFGPMAPLLWFKIEEENIRIANDTDAGLDAYIFTNNVQWTWRVSEALEYGLVGVFNFEEFSFQRIYATPIKRGIKVA
ncbi:hypothetical protein GQ457_07G014910 [Hibiscus cannabinus]